ncbi:heavy metal translocating P-type ATPase [Clostridioides difficile]
MEIKLVLNGLNCANCANKIENKVNKINGIKEASLNFSTTVLTAEIHEESLKDEIIREIKSIVKKLEPHVNVEEKYDEGKIINKTTTCSSGCCDIGHKHKIDENNKSHGHDHVHEFKENESGILGYAKDNIMLIIGTIIYVIALIYKGNENLLSVLLFAASYLVIGGEVVLTAIKNIARGEVFDENFLMSIATIGAFFIGEYPEAVAVMLFYQIGEVFQGYAVNKSRKSISSLMNIRADYANVLRNNSEVKVSPEEVVLDEIIVIKPGERIPLDGIVLEGTSFIDTSALTGESVPREVNVGSEILSGAINNNGVLKVKVNKEYGQSTVARILELVENASNKKAPTEKFITKFAKVYTPIVVAISVLVAVIPPLVIKDATFSEWIYKALSILVVSCPCALVVSIPLGFFSGIGGASKKGILVKGGNYLESLKDSEIVVFDKTGTLTKGVFNVTQINPKNISKEELLEITAIGESLSNHPIAISIANAYGKEIDKNEIKDYKEISGHGIEVTIRGKNVLLGNSKLMRVNNINYEEIDSIGTIVHVAVNEEYKGNIVISDEVKDNVKEALKELKSVGIKKTVMLTGDNKVVAEKVAKSIGIDEVYSELLPGDKVNKVETILTEKTSKGKVLFVGDGINDAPVLARADIGVAMGGIGSDAAIEAADVVLMKDKVEAIAEAIRVSRRTNKILWQNIIFSLGVKVAVMILVVLGLTDMWAAVFADVGVTLIAVLNSMRIIR